MTSVGMGSITVYHPQPTIGDYEHGYQGVPINWTKSTTNKVAFFDVLSRDAE